MDSIFDESNLTSKAINWVKLSNVDDRVYGILEAINYKPEEGKFSAQITITLKNEEGVLNNVSIRDNVAYREALSGAMKGDRVGVMLSEKLPPKIKGHSPTNVFKIFVVRQN